MAEILLTDICAVILAPGGTVPECRDEGALLARPIKRRHMVTGAFAAAVTAACSTSKSEPASSPSHASPSPSSTSKAASAHPKGALIGDGSTSNTGPQPNQPKVTKLKPGEEPPQFVVVSWDGAGENVSRGLLKRFRQVAKELDASMTLFLSGIYFLPEAKKDLYDPPHFRKGASDIGYLDSEDIHATIKGIGEAWLEGHEIGTHFNGHFCGRTGVAKWSVDDWLSEIRQAKEFVTQWKTNTGITDLPALPFDYEKELIGGRTPCLEGGENLRKAAKKLGWRYDSSMNRPAMWPSKEENGLWDLSMVQVPMPGHASNVVAMDYNIMVNGAGTTKQPASEYPQLRKQATATYLAGFNQAYDGNRAPLIIGNHFEQWNGGVYMDAVEAAMRAMAKKPNVRMVSFRQLCDWLDAQDEAVLTKLRALAPGQKPAEGWAKYLA